MAKRLNPQPTATEAKPEKRQSGRLQRIFRKRNRIALLGIILLVLGLAFRLGALDDILADTPLSIIVQDLSAGSRSGTYGYAVNGPLGTEAALSPLSPVFTPEVQYWGDLIRAWAVVYQVDPNLIATVIQIESCGDPMVSSPSGAQGLFQVMPFHFLPGEDMLDVQTNARRGLDYLLGGLQRSGGHAGLALAGYNGGHGVINRGWETWHSETRRYYRWGSAIYAEAIAGMDTSPALDDWLNAGGRNLCNQANSRLKQIQAQEQASLAALS
ncbi:MAG: lytic transglycosylase domain-containing protein [Chloroflexi bacterium]|nr:lytic transglycosylase domain-containing protein [Chloroflexota bacterium]